MTEDFKAGKIAAYKEMKTYATSMIGAPPTGKDYDPWLDMSFYAYTNIDEIENGVDIPEDVEVDLAHG